METSNLNILSKINTPDDLRKLRVEELPQVCKELREDIVKELSVNPGHLASSLGVVELTVALHYVYNTPEDRIVWDVGHQAYGHKILTGRRDKFCTNRKLHGIMPFPSPKESVYDTFTCGHASNSISAALGMAVAASCQSKKEGQSIRKVVAVIGDGAMSGGLAFEGLNNASSSPNDLLIILNDNNMSIDRSVGGMKEYLINLNTNETYNRIRFKAAQWLHGKGMLEEDRRKGLIRLSNAVKSAISHQQNIFEGMNIRYFGPFNGHNVIELVRLLRQLKDMKGPKLLHLHTKKGFGYAPAEKDVTVWHAPGKFDAETGKRLNEDSANKPPKFQDVFGNTLLELAEKNEKIVGVTPAMPTGCSMNIMMKAMPKRTFDVGIAEGHAVTFSAGMAKDGLLPFCNIYSAFSQRPVPNLTISSPMNEHELRKLMFTAQLPGKGSFVIRYPRGRGVLVDWKCEFEEIEVGTGRKLVDGTDIAILSIGPIGNNVTKAIRELYPESADNDGTLPVAHYDMRFLKPLDERILHEVGERFEKIITIEDGVRNGGLGSAVIEWMNDHGYHPTVKRLGLPDEFIEHGTVAELQNIAGIDADNIKNYIKELL